MYPNCPIPKGKRKKFLGRESFGGDVCHHIALAAGPDLDVQVVAKDHEVINFSRGFGLIDDRFWSGDNRRKNWSGGNRRRDRIDGLIRFLELMVAPRVLRVIVAFGLTVVVLLPLLGLSLLSMIVVFLRRRRSRSRASRNVSVEWRRRSCDVDRVGSHCADGPDNHFEGFGGHVDVIIDRLRRCGVVELMCDWIGSRVKFFQQELEILLQGIVGRGWTARPGIPDLVSVVNAFMVFVVGEGRVHVVEECEKSERRLRDLVGLLESLLSYSCLLYLILLQLVLVMIKLIIRFLLFRVQAQPSL